MKKSLTSQYVFVTILNALTRTGSAYNCVFASQNEDRERYRSGHNEAVLKTVCLHGHMGSNPILSAYTAMTGNRDRL